MARKDFHHPFQPYDIQQQFMEEMYKCIEDRQVGIFESPTGTGKSLSLICSSLTWLREHKRKTFDEALASVKVDDDDPEWVAEHAREMRQREVRQMKEDFEARLKAIRDREQKVRDRTANSEPARKKRKAVTDDEKNTSEDERYELDDYDSDSDGPYPGFSERGYSAETVKLMEQLGILPKTKPETIDNNSDELKIFFSSRTHSQLSQFVGELQRVKLPPGLPGEPQNGNEAVSEHLKQLTLGSRKNLCINPKVAKLGNVTAINEQCTELQQPSTAKEHKCPYLPNKENEDMVLDFRDHALAKIRDIEDLATLGNRLGICPYYASRPAIGPAEMISLPYPLLLQKSARDALGISLKDNVVVIDEAHNLVDAIEGIYSAQISQTQLKQARASLMVYIQRFRNRLKGRNRVYVTQIVRVLDSLLLFMAGLDGDNRTGNTVEPGELLSGKGVDLINLTKLVRYVESNKLARKVDGYVSHASQPESGTSSRAKSDDKAKDVPALRHVQNFLMTLMNPSKDGRFFWAREHDELILRYMLLDPSEHFREVIEDARAVILAGGTMSPMDDYKAHLFPYLTSIVTFSCGHLIPPNNLLVRTIATDKDGPLEFNYKSRDKTSFLRIGAVLSQFASSVKGGLVVFFPSYRFIEQVAEAWRSASILADLQVLKPVFWDSRDGSAEETFKAYSDAITGDHKGAILLSVIGGKLSEGINFSDDLGRCVVVVGLPFPNLGTPEWKAKLKYIDDKAATIGAPRGKASRDHVENVCMRSVNQAIGRAIRHKDDWASIILMDSRYNQDRVRGKLPGWIRRRLPVGDYSYVYKVARDIETFFNIKGH